MRKIYAVTGAAGFIGSHVVDMLRERGHTPIIFDRLGRSHRPDVEVFLGDVRDPTSMFELAAHVDGIIHLAACLGTQETVKNPKPAAETNIIGGLNFLEACAQYDIPGVYIGVGNHFMNNSYSITKTTVERFVHMYNKERGTKVNIVRLVNAYGPRQSVAPPFGSAKVRKITPAFICRALTGQDIEIYGDGEQISDMVHVLDGALTLVKSLEFAHEGNIFTEPIECGPKDSFTVNEVALKIIDLAKEHNFTPVNLVHLPMRPGETPGARVSANWETLEKVGMDVNKLINLEDGLKDTIRWYINNWLPKYSASNENA